MYTSERVKHNLDLTSRRHAPSDLDRMRGDM